MSFFHLNERFVMEEGKFNRLSLAERAHIVWEKGQFVDSVLRNQYCLMLYTINHQFIELYLDLHSQRIVWISMANEHDLEKYLNNIQLEV